MKFFSTAATLLIAAASAGLAIAQSALTINTPGTSVLTCVPVLIQWSGGSAPYYLTVVSNPSTSFHRRADGCGGGILGQLDSSVAKGVD